MEVVTIDQVCQLNLNLMGTNDPTISEIEESYILDGPFPDSNVDVTVIAGRPSNGQSEHYPLLLLRFWKKSINTTKVNFKKFFDESMELIPRKGVSVTRLGLIVW